MKKTTMALCGFALMSIAGTASAEYIIHNAKIASITNTGSNQATFAIKTKGGTGYCAGHPYIKFPVTASADEGIHKRAYQAALTALANNLTVRVHNYYGTDCNNASYIEVYAAE